MSDDRSLVPAGQGALVNQGVDQIEIPPGAKVRRWAEGQATLKELKGYTDEELYHIAQHAYTLYLNGKFRDAQTMFEGLVAINPRNEYYYRGLGVVYHRRGDADRAIRQFGHAIKVAPRSPTAYVNRAEVHISRRDFPNALEDLAAAIRIAPNPSDPIVRKAAALRSLLLRERPRLSP